MAFRQPALQVVRERTRDQPQLPVQTTPELQRQIDDSQEWVLFSPAAPSTAISSDRTPRTAGLSHLSDFGSLRTIAAPSEDDGQEGAHQATPSEVEEEEELDSLDSHLHAFREPSESRRFSAEHSAGIFPTHDGLGTFPASSTSVQAQLYSFEQFNPHRQTSSRRAADVLHETEKDNDNMERIQQWRMEQSRLVLDEIEKETRRRRMSVVSGRSRIGAADEDSVAATSTSSQQNSLRQKDPTETQKEDSSDETDDSLWTRITRRFMRDLMGIDDSVLSVIFGESLPDSENSNEEGVPLSSASAPRPESAVDQSQPGWQDRLIERIARELGVLVHQISGHPGAFSTYLRTQQEPDYVGSTTPTQHKQTSNPDSTNLPSRLTLADRQSVTSRSASVAVPEFSPTIPHHHTNARTSSIHHAETWGVDESPHTSSFAGGDSRAAFARRKEAERLKYEREYWERELDVSMMFSFLKNRFRRRSSTSNATTSGSRPSHTTPNTAAARAAVIRQHHPLVSASRHPAHVRRSSNIYHQPTSPTALSASAALLKRKSSSCAAQSQSSNKSRRSRAAAAATSGGSRNYWDLGGSSASAIASMGGLGTWGEV
ncbi:MAG: riboflavin kinase [Chaenotheca gracillima]|nr:MAG: riboflavin kinase [Chaenotheca gracillima]